MRISSRYALVPPLETISTPSSTSPCANSSRPDLSWTEISARSIIGSRGGGSRGNREVPPVRWRRGIVGQTGFPPRERAKGERRSRGYGGRQLAVEEEPGRLRQQ